jgi:hypothetical protein
MIAVVLILLAMTILVATDDDASGNSDDTEPRSLVVTKVKFDTGYSFIPKFLVRAPVLGIGATRINRNEL